VGHGRSCRSGDVVIVVSCVGSAGKLRKTESTSSPVVTFTGSIPVRDVYCWNRFHPETWRQKHVRTQIERVGAIPLMSYRPWAGRGHGLWMLWGCGGLTGISRQSRGIIELTRRGWIRAVRESSTVVDGDEADGLGSFASSFGSAARPDWRRSDLTPSGSESTMTPTAHMTQPAVAPTLALPTLPSPWSRTPNAR